MPNQIDFIRLQTQLYEAMRAAPADALSDTDRALLALPAELHEDE